MQNESVFISESSKKKKINEKIAKLLSVFTREQKDNFLGQTNINQ